MIKTKLLSVLPLIGFIATASGAMAQDSWSDLSQSGRSASKQGFQDQAEAYFQKAVKTAESAYGPTDSRLAESLSDLARLYAGRGQYNRAELLDQRVVSIYETSKGDSPDTANALRQLGDLYRLERKYMQAESVLKKAMAIDSKLLAPDSSESVLLLDSLGLVYLDQSKFAQSEPLLKRSLESRNRTLSPDDPLVATSLENYARLLRRTQRSQQAQPLEERARAIKSKI